MSARRPPPRRRLLHGLAVLQHGGFAPVDRHGVGGGASFDGDDLVSLVDHLVWPIVGGCQRCMVAVAVDENVARLWQWYVGLW